VALHKLIKTLQTSGVKLAMGEGAYAPYPEYPQDPQAAMEPPPAPPSLWDQYKIPAMLAGGALLGGYGLHHYFKGEDAAQAAKATSTIGDAAKAEGRNTARIRLGLNAEDTANLNKRPEGLLNQKQPSVMSA